MLRSSLIASKEYITRREGAEKGKAARHSGAIRLVDLADRCIEGAHASRCGKLGWLARCLAGDGGCWSTVSSRAVRLARRRLTMFKLHHFADYLLG
jgi:hypothetical protein